MFQRCSDSILQSMVHSKEVLQLVHRDSAGLKVTLLNMQQVWGGSQLFGLFQQLGGAQCKHDCKNTCLKIIPFSAHAAKLLRNKLMFDAPFPSQTQRLFWRGDQVAVMGLIEMCLLYSPH